MMVDGGGGDDHGGDHGDGDRDYGDDGGGGDYDGGDHGDGDDGGDTIFKTTKNQS